MTTIAAASAPALERKPVAAMDHTMGLRFIACVMVVVTHWFNAHHKPWYLWPAGEPAVWAFFGLSAYLMGMAFHRHRYATNYRGVCQFLTNRCLRIIPLSALTVAMFWPTYNYSSPATHEILLQWLKLYTITPEMVEPYNGALWSILVEFRWYCLVPFLYLAVSRWMTERRAMVLFPLIVLAGIVQRGWLYSRGGYSLGYEHVSSTIYHPFAVNLDCFLPCFLLNWMRPIRLPMRWAWFLIAAWIFAGAFTFGHRMTEPWGMAHMVLLPALTTIIVALFILASAGSRTTSSWARWVWWAGTLTFGVYVWHTPVFKWMVGRAAWQVFPVVLTVAVLTYWIIEKPVELLKRRGA